MTKTSAAVESLQILDIKDVIPTPDMPRTPADNDPKIKSMAESIKVLGQQEPVIVRPHPDRPGKFDLRDGARRLKACVLAGLSTVKAIVRTMDDKQAREVTMISFLHREGLSPLQEARGIEMLLGDGKEVEAIAADIGRSVSFVQRRRQLTKLIPAWLKAHEDPTNDISRWSAAHLELVARFDEAVQERILKSLEQEYDIHCWTLDTLEDHLGDFLHVLRLAPWDLNDGGLVKKAGSCVACQKRSECRPYLFAEAAARKAGSSQDKCLDADCWNNKDKAWMARKVTLLKEQHPDLVMIDRVGGSNGKALCHWQFEPAKQKDKGAVPAVVVKGNDRGALVYVKVKKEAEHKVTAAKPKTLKELRAELDRKRLDVVIENLEAALADKKVVAVAADHELIAWLLCFEDFSGDDSVGNVLDLLKKGGKVIRKEASDRIKQRAPSGCYSLAEARVVAKLFNVDLDPMISAAEKAHPEPEEWANLKADGTPKTCTKCGHKPHDSVCGTACCTCMGPPSNKPALAAASKGASKI